MINNIHIKKARQQHATPTYLYYGVLSAALCLITFGLWAGLANIDSATRAAGVVISKGHNKIVSSLHNGIVESILVEDGDYVSQGQLLVQLERSDADSELEGLQFRLDSLKARKHRLSAHLNGMPELNFSGLFSQQSENHRQLIESERKLFYLHRKQAATTHAMHQQAIQRLNILKQSNRQQLDTERSILDMAETELADKRRLMLQGHISKKTYQDQLNNVRKLKLSYSTLLNNKDIYDSEITQKQIALDEFSRQQLADMSNEYNDTITNMRVLNAKIKSFVIKLQQSSIRSPVNGYVFNLQQYSQGATLQAGHKILEIRPDSDNLVVNAKIATHDINHVKVGMPAKFRIDAFNSFNAPDFDGYISHVSADRIRDEDNNDAYFLVELTPNKSNNSISNKYKLSTGMGASVLIINGESTLLEYLLNPIAKSFEQSLVEASL